MKLAKVTTNGRISIPPSLREKYGFHFGTKVKFVLAEDGFWIIPLVTKEVIQANIGFLGTRGKLIKALMREKKFECKL